MDPLSRTVFVVPLSAEPVSVPAPEEVALVCRDFRGVVDPLDLFVFALWNGPPTSRPPEHRALLAHTVAQVAQWDGHLADRLLEAPLNEALSPVGLLQDYAGERRWTAETPRLWAVGTSDGLPDRPVVHSALLAVSGESRAVRAQIWAAQAAVLLPLVEENRVALIRRYSRRLRLPVMTDRGEVADPLDLEVGQLAWLLDRSGEPWKLRKQLRRLRNVRNALAHMEPLPPDEVLHPSLLGER